MASQNLPPNPNGSASTSRRGGKLATRYRTALTALSTRTGTALPSLITSFAILHELTAIVPLVGVFYACRATGVGERAVAVLRTSASASSSNDGDGTGELRTLVGRTTERWLTEGEAWAGRVGRRYGVFGYQKGRGVEGVEGAAPRDAGAETGPTASASAALAGDVANALVAYCATKALLPARVGLSLYLSPAFSRRVVDPVARGVASVFRPSSSK